MASMEAGNQVDQIDDGQVQVKTDKVENSPVTPAAEQPGATETVKSTTEVVVTSCPPEVSSCPASTVKPTPNAEASNTAPNVSSTSATNGKESRV